MAESMTQCQACKALFPLLQTKVLKEELCGGSGLSFVFVPCRKFGSPYLGKATASDSLLSLSLAGNSGPLTWVRLQHRTLFCLCPLPETRVPLPG